MENEQKTPTLPRMEEILNLSLVPSDRTLKQDSIVYSIINRFTVESYQVLEDNGETVDVVRDRVYSFCGRKKEYEERPCSVPDPLNILTFKKEELYDASIFQK